MSCNSCKIKDYSRINPNTGAGFILKRLNELNSVGGGVTKRAVYEGTRYGHWTPGYHSSIWAKLLEDGLVSPWNGFMDVKECPSPYPYGRVRAHVRARGQGTGKNYTVKYFITELGWNVLKTMNARVAAVKKVKKESCTRDDIRFGTEKPALPCPLPYTYATNTPVDPTRTPESGPEALDKLEHFDPDLAARLDSIISELQAIRNSL